MYTYEYDTTYLPSLPVVAVEVKAFDQDSEPSHLVAMVDSGSDGTLVPLSVLRQMKARKTSQVALRSITGVRTIVDIYEVTIHLGPHLFPKVRVAADRHNNLIILGRDVLNQIIVTLNGLASTTEVHE
jgi:predicted aspartyl protease